MKIVIKDQSDIIELLGDHERMGMKYGLSMCSMDKLTDHRRAVYQAIKEFYKNHTSIEVTQFENGDIILGYADGIYYVQVGKEIHQYAECEMEEIYHYKS